MITEIRPPMTEADRDRMEREMYPSAQPKKQAPMYFINKRDLFPTPDEVERVELDIYEYEWREREPWAKKQARLLKG